MLSAFAAAHACRGGGGAPTFVGQRTKCLITLARAQECSMSLRPPDPKRITTADLVPGDVILSCGPKTDDLDNLIKLVDQGDYSHTSLYIGVDKTRPMVVEATKGGIRYDDIDVDLDAQDLVDVYRYVSPQGNHLGDPGWPAQPILDRAMSFVGANYAYDELFLGAVVLLAAEKSSSDPDLNALLRLCAMLVAKGLLDWLTGAKNDGKTPMTCVEVATTAFWQADSVAHKYALQVQLVRAVGSGGASISATPQKTLSPADMQKLRSLKSEIHAGIAKTSPQLLTAAARTTTTSDVPPPQTVGGAILGLCTPRDMETSPTLKFVGCLQDKNAPAGKRAS